MKPNTGLPWYWETLLRLQTRRKSAFVRYGVAVLVTIIVLAIRVALNPFLGSESPMVALILAVVFSAAFGGWGPGIFATALSFMLANYFLFEPVGEFGWRSQRDTIRIVLFLIEGIALSGAFSALHGTLRGTLEVLRKQAETSQALQRSEELYKSVINTIADGVVTMNDDGTVEGWNESARHLFGYETSEVIGRKIGDLILEPPVNGGNRLLEAYRQTRERQVRGGGHEVEAKRKDGFRFPIDLAVADFYVGEKRYFTGVVRDITERKRFETELWESRESLNRIIETSPIAIVVLDNRQCVLIWNSAAERLFGWPHAEIQNDLLRIVPPDLREERDQITKHARQVQAPFQIETRRLRKDGAVIDVSLSLSALRDEAGNIQGVVQMFSDITERKQREETLRMTAEQLRLSQERLELALDASHQAVWEYDLRSDLFQHAENYRSVLGLAPGAKIQTLEDFLSLVEPDDREMLRQDIEMSRRGEKSSSSTEFRVREANGERRWISSRARLILDSEGRPDRIVGVAVDVTEVKRSEAQLQRAKESAEFANSAKTQFLANMSHEMRTPLGVIVGLLDLLDEEATEAGRSRLIGIIQRNADQLAKLIDQVLDLSKIEAQSLHVERIRVKFAEVIDDVVVSLGVKAQEKGIFLRVESTKDVPVYLATDPLRLRQILLNIIGNAIKFTEKGGVTVHLSSYPDPRDAAHSYIRFVVEDTGIGLTHEQRNRLFKPFTQGDPSMTRRFGGTGLGLILSRRLAQALGGDLELTECRPGGGCKFTFTVQGGPFNAEEHAPIELQAGALPAKSEPPPKAPKPLAGIPVLVVDDSADNRFMISRFLGLAGAEVDLASDGREAVDMAMRKRYGAVLMDIQMPLVDGNEATRQLRGRGYSRPVIAITAHALREDRERALRTGFDDYLTKPVDRRVLVEKISKYARL